MQILIVKDSSTKIPKDASAAEVERLIAAGFVVELVKPDNSVVQVAPGSSAAQIEAHAQSLVEQTAEPEFVQAEVEQPEPIPAAHADMDETIQLVTEPEPALVPVPAKKAAPAKKARSKA